MVGGTGSKEKKNIYICIYMITGITTLRNNASSSSLLLLLLLLLLYLFIWLVEV